MIRHFTLIAFRSFARFKSTFIINLVGLSTGLTCTLLIYLWVQDELSIDAFHQNGDRLYQVMTNHHNADGIVTMDATPDPLAEALANEVLEIEYAAAATPSSWFGDFVLDYGVEKTKARGEFVSNDYFKLFSFPLLKGNPSTLLTDKNSIAVSRSLALRMFNSEDVIGKTMTWRIINISNEVTITGVFQDLPSASSEHFDFVLSFDYWKQMLQSGENWDNYGASAYILLKDKVDASTLGAKISGFIKTKNPNANTTLLLQPYADKYLHGNYTNGNPSGGKMEYVRVFSIIAGFILVIACINFMNLSTARAARRLKEIGIKKAFGVARSSLAFQFLAESQLVATICLAVAIVAVQLTIPLFNIITGKALQLSFTTPTLLALLSTALITGLLAGSYPAILLSGFSPGEVLKGRVGATPGEGWSRKGLVVFQFSLTIILISSVLVVYKQIEFIQSKNVGFDKDHVIHFQKEGAVADKLDVFLEQVRALPQVSEASSLSQNVIDVQAFTSDVSWPGKDESKETKFTWLVVDHKLPEALGMEMVAGRSFSKEFHDTPSRVLFNEAAIRLMGLKDPVGQHIHNWGQDKEIIGVVKDFHFQSLRETVKPVIFILASEPLDLQHVVVRLKGGSETAAIENMKALYKEFNPGYSFDYTFLDQDFQHQYTAELRVAALSKYFAGIAVAISCLGLFGLATFTAERRQKEIGIRKVLGSSTMNVVLLLSGDFTRIVLVSFVIGVPLSWLAAREWLSTFAFSIQLEWWYFLIAGLSALVVAWATVGTQALKAARTNPAEVLRSE